ncbi:MAG: LEA type 2 family protein [Deltaproteobacteria bacterium]|nr:LEA type 2 family protein [Deltaproteobacteria bacterium]
MVQALKGKCFCRAALIPLIITILYGCAAPGKRLEAPQISLADIGIEKIGLLEQVLQVDLRIVNTNEVPLQIKGIDCSLIVNDRKLASGVSDRKTKIPALGTATVAVSLYTSLPDVVKGFFSLKEKEAINYKVTGRLHTEGQFLMPALIPFSAEGTLASPEK